MNPVLLAGVLIAGLIVTVAGAVVTIVQPHTLSFSTYVQYVIELAAALGLTAGFEALAVAASVARRGGQHD